MRFFRLRPTPRIILSALLLAPLAGAALHAQTSTLNRPADPVVITGADIPSLLGIPPGDLVAFRYINGSWQQAPVQVDERAVVDYGILYNTTPTGKTLLTYSDPNTWAGPDANSTLDGDDEVVFMARDAGGRPLNFTEPAGIIPNTGVEIIIGDPLNQQQFGYLYLFRQAGGLAQGAGVSYVNYTFNLLSGNYKATYRTNGPNPENSNITTSHYYHHYTDRWINDELKIFTPGSNRADILDRHKTLYAPGVCRRTEETFAGSGGIFVINKNGPVRAIRSYMGANSGPYTQREHLFYQGRQDVISYLRVHDIAAIVDFFDYTPNAFGMRYWNNLNPGGVIVNGVPDQVATGVLTGEMMSGAPGSLVMAFKTETTIPGLTVTSYYEDDSNTGTRQCTGDRDAIGSSGPWWQGIPCTDPVRGDCVPVHRLDLWRYMYYDSPDLQPANGQVRINWALNPLIASSRLWR